MARGKNGTAGGKPEKPQPVVRKGGRAPKYNYELAQQYYVEGMPTDPDEPDGDRDWPTLRVIAERMDIPYQRIKERSSMERWNALKTAYQTEQAQQRQKDRIKQLGKESIEFDNRGLDIAKIGLQLIGVRMGEIAGLVKAQKAARDEAVERMQRGEPVEKHELWSQIRADEMERLAKAASTLQDIGRKALGTDVQQVNIEGQVQVAHAISVAQELERDDPDRLAAFMAAADRAGLWQQLEASGELTTSESYEDEDGEDIVEAEVVEEEG